MKSSNVRLLCLAGAMMLSAHTYAQDSVRITLQEAEQQFVQKNLQLAAEKYNIDIAKAQALQTRAYPNPNLAIAGNIYDPTHNKAFNVSNKDGEYQAQIQQLVRLAGKRNKEIKLAGINADLAEAGFTDLMRTLRYSLRSTFFNILYLQKSVNAYTAQINSLQKLSAAYDNLQGRDVVTLKDAVRIKSLFYSLKAEQAGLINQLSDAEADLQILLQNNKAYYEAVNDAPSQTELSSIDLNAAIDTAYANRSDLKQAKTTILYNNQNLSLQKAMATPDLTLGAQFDKRGSFVDNATFFTVAMDLPFFNKNKGNIKAAKISVDQSKVQADMQANVVENDVKKAYVKALNTDKLLQSVDPKFNTDFEKLLGGITDNFQKKNISLIEFTDFIESYKNNVLQYNSLRNDRMQALEQLNFAVGKTITNN